MDIGNIHAIQTESLQGFRQTRADPVRREVPNPTVSGVDLEGVVVCAGPLRIGTQQPTHLGGDHIRVAGVSGKKGAQPPFGQTESIVWCGIEVTYPGIPRGGQNPVHLGIGTGPEEVAELSATEAEGRDLDHGCVHRWAAMDSASISAPEPGAVGVR